MAQTGDYKKRYTTMHSKTKRFSFFFFLARQKFLTWVAKVTFNVIYNLRNEIEVQCDISQSNAFKIVKHILNNFYTI